MIFKIKQLGPLEQAEFELADFTIICGQNNSGKTYATYVLFGFLDLWRSVIDISVEDSYIEELLEEGYVELELKPYFEKVPELVKVGCRQYTKELLADVLASSPRRFTETEFSIELYPEDLNFSISMEQGLGSTKRELFKLTKKREESILNITLLSKKEQVNIPAEAVGDAIAEAIKDLIFSPVLPIPFIASAERTGAAIFRKELDFARNRMFEQISKGRRGYHTTGIGYIRERDDYSYEYSLDYDPDYALPVNANIDFTRKLEEVSRKDSFISNEAPELLNEFADIVGGEYLVTDNDELFFKPEGENIRLTMDESSSAVRSLVDIGFYIRHVAKRGDLLMIDEPELNLHPENQRRVARLLARLVNLGVKVFVTTHSDYFIKELNTLIMLNQDRPGIKEITEREGYKKEELLDSGKLRVYIADKAPVLLEGDKRKKNCQTLIPADIDPKLGIEVTTFDTAIDTMNRIQEEIIWGGE